MERGYSLVEATAVLAIISILTFVVVRSNGQILSVESWFTRSGVLENQVLEADKLIRRLGRVANSCAVVGASLECQVDFGSPPVGVLQRVRFIQSGNQLQYQWWITGAVTWETRVTYSPITSFRVCDCAAMPACSIGSPGLNQIVAAAGCNAAYFRYAVTGQMVDNLKNYSFSTQSAFFARNSAAATNGFTYQW